MKVLTTPPDFFKTPKIIKILAFIFLTVAFFYLGKHWSDSDTFQKLTFFNTHLTPSVSLSPNLNTTLNITSLINPPPPTPPIPAPILSFPPPPDYVRSFGIVDENGTMTDDFEVGEFDPDLVENWGNGTDSDSGSVLDSGFRVKRYGLCGKGMMEYIPCLDNVDAIKRLKSTEKGERFERHCPEEGKGLDCLIPSPKGYRQPLPWPKSRDEVWFSNVPHTRLVEDKGGQNWITRVKDRFRFPGGGTQFIHGADGYLDQISNMIPNIAFGGHTRVVMDVGCGVASFGAYLLSRNVLTMSVAPKDVHENQIQFALERGVPAMVSAFATRRLLYPSQAFEMIHCSRCRINWTRDDGILLLEVNRMLRAGGYFAWAAQPVYKHEDVLEEQWEEMLNLTTRLCWELVKKEGYIAIWQKPYNNSCYLSREAGTKPPLCDANDDPDNVWYVDLTACITRLPENGYGANVTMWPDRLQTPPDRLQSIKIDAFIARKELFKAEAKYWNEIIASYVRAFHWKKMRLRNVLDMKAGFGGFAAALIDNKLDAWVLNVVPVSGPNTLPVIYDRGLLGVMHDWCEPFDTYPRTYDFLHAAGLFSIERKRCNMSTIMLEMDRILRPGGQAYIRDSLDVMDELQAIANAMGWRSALRDTAEGPHASYRILTCEKQLLRA
ncbi:Methyltransf_29 domain-containing protein [Cephalotus follicularis]|uniref:Methyltransferase n=1 Tax=Cephalotus follicularis TaxID=3775 RepID=A0A1Q3BR39_CEPFO|nr:Methyltransf_29 domain-containing protein [Cephalotus follicularis]